MVWELGARKLKIIFTVTRVMEDSNDIGQRMKRSQKGLKIY